MPPVNIDRNLKDVDPAWLTVPLAWTLAILVGVVTFATGSGPDRQSQARVSEQAHRSKEMPKPLPAIPEAGASEQVAMP